MGQYKVPQDVEAEDKIIGPLTIKQFLYAVIGTGIGIATFVTGKYFPPLYVIGAFPTLLFLALGLWQRQDQPFEALFLALVSFTVKPRKRIWLKEPIVDIFKIEPPKPTVEAPPIDPREIMGQLEKLSQVVDTRGWSAKQPEIQEPAYLATPGLELDSRIGAVHLDQAVYASPASDVGAADDILDLDNNPSAQGLNTLIEDSVKNIRAEAMHRMEEAAVAPATTQDVGQLYIPQPSQPAINAPGGGTATLPSDILKQALEVPELKVSQIAAQAQRYNQLAEGQSVTIPPITTPNAA